MAMTSSKPNGSRIQRQKRKMAELRSAAIGLAVSGRQQAVDALLVRARNLAFPVRMPRVHTVRGMRDRLKTWFLHRAADLVAWKIDRDTYRVGFERLENLKMGVDAWLNTMRGLSAQ